MAPIKEEKIDVEFYPDGDLICCVRRDFINLLESPAGFGETAEEAYDDLIENEAK